MQPRCCMIAAELDLGDYGCPGGGDGVSVTDEGFREVFSNKDIYYPCSRILRYRIPQWNLLIRILCLITIVLHNADPVAKLLRMNRWKTLDMLGKSNEASIMIFHNSEIPSMIGYTS